MINSRIISTQNRNIRKVAKPKDPLEYVIDRLKWVLGGENGIKKPLWIDVDPEKLTDAVMEIIDFEIKIIWAHAKNGLKSVYEIEPKRLETTYFFIKQFIYGFVCKLRPFYETFEDFKFKTLSNRLVLKYPKFIFFNTEPNRFESALNIIPILDDIEKSFQESNKDEENRFKIDKTMDGVLYTMLNYKNFCINRKGEDYYDWLKHG